MWRSLRFSILLLLGTFLAGGVQGQNITEFSVPTLGAAPYAITSGPDGNLWFTEELGNKIAQITTSGVITEVPFPAVGDAATGIAAGPDGNVWVTTWWGWIARVTPTGVITWVGSVDPGWYPAGVNRIVVGADGNLWFTEQVENKIGRITPTGDITEFEVPSADGGPFGIAAGPDGNIWFTHGFDRTSRNETLGNKIGRITTSGAFTLFTVPTAKSGIIDIAAGPDGNLWFAESSSNKIGRITTSGVITEFPVPMAGGGPLGGPSAITAGPDGAVWFTHIDGNKIARITTSGEITEFPIPSPNAVPVGITSGPDGNIWFTQRGGNRIGRLALGGISGACVPDSTTLCLRNARFQARANWTTSDGRSGAAQAVSLTGSAGYFWFFSSDNVEVMVKIVDGCALNSNYWVFAGGLTDAHVAVTVTDTTNGAVRTYTNPLGVAFQPIQDTTTFRGP